MALDQIDVERHRAKIRLVSALQNSDNRHDDEGGDPACWAHLFEDDQVDDAPLGTSDEPTPDGRKHDRSG